VADSIPARLQRDQAARSRRQVDGIGAARQGEEEEEEEEEEEREKEHRHGPKLWSPTPTLFSKL
jgi:hypothetical protein